MIEHHPRNVLVEHLLAEHPDFAEMLRLLQDITDDQDPLGEIREAVAALDMPDLYLRPRVDGSMDVACTWCSDTQIEAVLEDGAER